MDQHDEVMSRDALRQLLFSDGEAVRQQFCERFPDLVEQLIDGLWEAFQQYRELDALVAQDKRLATVVAFYYTALNSLFTSGYLLLIGLLVPAGNLMRHFGEAVAMALLCCDARLDAYDRFTAGLETFPITSAVDRVNRKRTQEILEVDAAAWASFRELTKFYDKYSHASFLSVASQFMFDRPGFLAFGGEFDPSKHDSYHVELTRRTTAAAGLAGLGEYLVERQGRDDAVSA